MATGIALNGDYTIAQPTDITEGVVQIVHDNTSIYGVVRRIWLAQKHTVKLQWSNLTMSEYEQIVDKFYGTFNAVTYTNTYSGLSITGYATAAEAPFIKGASFKRSLTMTIQET